MAKIGFDISMLVYAGSGVATFTYQLVRQLLIDDKTNEYHLFYSSLRRPKNFYYLNELKKLGGNIHSWYFPPRLLRYCWGNKHILPIEWLTGKMDFFHTSDFLSPPLLPGTIGITTVHDLTWKIHPEWHTKDIIDSHKLKLIRTIHDKDIIICSSNNTKKDLLKHYPVTKNQLVYTNYLGVSSTYKHIFNKQTIKKIKSIYNISSRYIVYVGAIEPRKNITRLIEAFSKLIKIEKYSDISLVIAGRAGWKNSEVYDMVNKLKLQKHIIFPGFVQDSHLPTLYSGALANCYVSLYEGFGLPPLEAQACQCPVVCSNTSSLPEVINKSAVIVNPYSVDSIKNGIIECLEHRSEYIKKGILNSSKFTWKATANKFIQIINKNTPTANIS